MATIRDVAKHAGVAPTTVSHALSGKRQVAEATRARILHAAEELHYHPDAIARSLRSGRTRTVGLSLPLDIPGYTLIHTLFPEFIVHIADRLNNRDHKLLCLVSRTPETDDLRRLARAGEVDGMILLQVRLDDPRITALRAVGLPFVAIGRPADSRSVVSVDADLAAAGVLAAKHLFSLGHQRIGFLGDAPMFGYQRHALAGFRRAHREAGVPLRNAQLLGLRPSGGLRGALAPFLATTQPLTALITTSEVEAVSALHVLTDAGLRVPEDVSIINLGDSTLVQLARPPITVVGFSVLDESNLAVDLLLQLLDGHTPRTNTHIIPVQLLSRQSTGPADPSRSGRRLMSVDTMLLERG